MAAPPTLLGQLQHLESGKQSPRFERRIPFIALIKYQEDFSLYLTLPVTVFIRRQLVYADSPRTAVAKFHLNLRNPALNHFSQGRELSKVTGGDLRHPCRASRPRLQGGKAHRRTEDAKVPPFTLFRDTCRCTNTSLPCPMTPTL
jgi:hypothetical protein